MFCFLMLKDAYLVYFPLGGLGCDGGRGERALDFEANVVSSGKGGWREGPWVVDL